MSLTTMIDGKQHRELFKAIAPPKQMFRSLTEEPPFANAEPRTTHRFQLPESGLIGMAFDYLLRAQVARSTGDSWEHTVPWVATHGLEIVLRTSFGAEGKPITHLHHLALTDDMGRLESNTEKWLDLLGDFTDEETSIRHQICDRYQQVHASWTSFISGDVVAKQEMIDAVWFLAKLEDVFRAGGALSVHYNRPQMDPFGTLKRPPMEVFQDIEELWELLEENRGFFTGNEDIRYNPNFGEASHLVGGADADLLVGSTLIDIKTTVKWGYMWADAAQLVGYYVLAAMVGNPWLIERLAIYRSRFGRIEYVDCAEVRKSIDLLGFAEQLLDIRASALREGSKGKRSRQAQRMASEAMEEHEGRSAELLANAQRNLA